MYVFHIYTNTYSNLYRSRSRQRARHTGGKHLPGQPNVGAKTVGPAPRRRYRVKQGSKLSSLL